MKVTCEIGNYSNPEKPRIKVHNAWADETAVELEVNGERYKVNGEELISAVKKCMLNVFGCWRENEQHKN